MIDDAKAALRRALRIRRKALQASHPSAAEQLVHRFQAAAPPLPDVAALYSRQGVEIDALPLALHLAQAGVRIAAPVVVRPGEPLIFRAVDDVPRYGAADSLGPASDAPILTPGLIVVPLLAFDATGARLGQGGGYYDRTLAALRAGAAVFALGLAYAGQEIDSVPTGPYDQRLDGVLTETGLRLFPTES